MRGTGPTRTVRRQVEDRDRQVCARCGVAGTEIHHRVSRGAGGTSDPAINLPANLVLLCSGCHKHITEHPAEAYETGWSVRRNSNDDPEQIAMVDVWGYRFRLTNDFRIVRLGTVWDDQDRVVELAQLWERRHPFDTSGEAS